MIAIKDLLATGNTWSRQELTFYSDMDDRTVRNEIRKLRRDGVPVMAVADGGYRIASTEEEKRECILQLKNRALDLLTTLSKLTKSMNMDGQISFQELLDAIDEH